MTAGDDPLLEARWRSVLTRGPRGPARPVPPGPWVWLLPATYLLHIAEEDFCGEGFPAWAMRQGLLRLDERRFLLLNGACWAMMAAAVLLIRRLPALRWLPVALGTVVLINGLAHGAATVVTRAYVPGVVTGLALWLPLGAGILWHNRRLLPPMALRGAVLLGVVIHAVLTLIARGGRF